MDGYLRDKTRDDLEEEVRELREKKEELETTLTALREKKGGLENEKARLENITNLPGALTRQARAEEGLNLRYREWISHKLALRLLDEVKERYEEDSVIAYSSAIFREVTGGRYRDLILSLREKKITVVEDGHRRKELTELSRGTREQLLLSLRLGFIKKYEERAEPLPVVFDEVLVNFDDERAQRMAEVLTGYARDRQVLFFTCRKETLGLFPEKEIHKIDLI